MPNTKSCSVEKKVEKMVHEVPQVWIRQMLMSAFLLPTLVCGTAFLVNFIAIYYHASRCRGATSLTLTLRAIPFGTMVAVTCICLFVILPLTLVGNVLGRNLAGCSLNQFQ